MRGAPRVGFSETIRKIKARTSLLTRFRPPTWLTLETHVQYKRNPARCQFTTVLGVTKMSGWSTRTRTFATQPRTACAGQLIDGEVVARAEPAIADGEPGSRGRSPPGTENADQPTEEMSDPDASRTGEDTPASRPTEIRSARERKIQSFPKLGGLHHRYAVAA